MQVTQISASGGAAEHAYRTLGDLYPAFFPPITVLELLSRGRTKDWRQWSEESQSPLTKAVDVPRRFVCVSVNSNITLMVTFSRDGKIVTLSAIWPGQGNDERAIELLKALKQVGFNRRMTRADVWLPTSAGLSFHGGVAISRLYEGLDGWKVTPRESRQERRPERPSRYIAN